MEGGRQEKETKTPETLPHIQDIITEKDSEQAFSWNTLQKLASFWLCVVVHLLYLPQLAFLQSSPFNKLFFSPKGNII